MPCRHLRPACPHPQPTFYLLCYLAVFAVPAAYARCGPAMDAAVEGFLRMGLRIMLESQRVALMAAAGAVAAVLSCLPIHIVLRMSVAVAAGFGVLLYFRRAAVTGSQPCVAHVHLE